MIGKAIRQQVFRDTTSLYLGVAPDNVAPPLIRFARRYAGREILDYGCATGNYCAALAQRGYGVSGADIHPGYVAIARERGIDARLITDRAPFPDGSFDTVLLFEVLEHLPDPDAVLKDARRIARRRVLITTPNSGDMTELQHEGLLYEHVADLDHKNFFTAESLAELLGRHFPHVRVWKGNPLNPVGLFPGRPIRFLGKALAYARLLPARFYFRLYAVASVEADDGSRGKR